MSVHSDVNGLKVADENNISVGTGVQTEDGVPKAPLPLSCGIQWHVVGELPLFSHVLYEGWFLLPFLVKDN